MRSVLVDVTQSVKGLIDEAKAEFLPEDNSREFLFLQLTSWGLYFKDNWFHIPYFPAFHRPGWLLKYAVGPYNDKWAESLFSDFWAGVTVALTLIPQVG